MARKDCRTDGEGRIKMATISAPDVGACEDAYSRHLGYELIERGTVDETLAASWGTPRQAGSHYLVMGPASGTQVFVRFVESEPVREFVPLRSYGWAALEITVQDADRLNEQLKGSPFEIIGEPTRMDFNDAIYPMQVVGPAGDVLYLNQVNASLPDFDLPLARSLVDHIFITILAAPDMQKGVDFYKAGFGWGQGNSYEIPYSVINNAFGFPAERAHKLTMNCVGRIVNNEVDQYPSETIVRPCNPGMLPPGVSMVSFITESLEKAKVEFLTAPIRMAGQPYDGRRSATCVGAAGELAELIEAG
jgi:hypothetical protein